MNNNQSAGGFTKGHKKDNPLLFLTTFLLLPGAFFKQ
jgi:hypothetical protein